MIVTEAELRTLLDMPDDPPIQDLAVLQSIHSEAEDAVKRFLKYDPEQKSRIEYYPRQSVGGGLSIDYDPYFQQFGYDGSITRPRPGRIFSELQVQHLPIREITSIRVSETGHFGTTDDLQDVITATDDDLEDAVDLVTANPYELVEGQHFVPQWEQTQLCLSGIIESLYGWPYTTGSVRIEYKAGYTPGEFTGRSDDASVEFESRTGLIAGDGVSAAGIKRAVVISVTKMMHTHQNLKRDESEGFSGGTSFTSEKLQDYSYTRPGTGTGGGGLSALVGLEAELPPEAKRALADFVNWGTSNL